MSLPVATVVCDGMTKLMCELISLLGKRIQTGIESDSHSILGIKFEVTYRTLFPRVDDNL